MKRVAVFVLLGPILFVLCIWFLFLPLAILAGGQTRFKIEVDSYLAVVLGLMFGGFVLAVVDWLAEMLVMRPWFTAAIGWAIGALTLHGVFGLPAWWWLIVHGLLVGIPALVCSWLAKRKQDRKAQ